MWQGPGVFSPMMPPHTFPSSSFGQQMPMPYQNPGHQIPMLSDDQPAEIQTEFIRPPLSAIPPTPSDCLPQTGGIDWSLIASCSPEEVAESNDVETLSAVIETFVRAEFTQTEAQLMPNPLTAKLFKLLQIATHYLLDCQTQLQSDLEEEEKSTEMLKAKVKNLSATIIRYKDHAQKREKMTEQTEKCVVCGRRFKNITYLDGHMQRRHEGLVPAWRSLRSGQMQGMNEIMEQIDGLRQAVAKTHLELEKRKHVEFSNRDVSHIIKPTDEQARLMSELAKKQEELLEQARLQEEMQQRFRQEIRSQLDDAVIALRESQHQMLEQSQTIAKLPAPIVPDTAAHDDLEASLTTRLISKDLPKSTISTTLDSLLKERIPPPPECLKDVPKPVFTLPPEKEPETAQEPEPEQKQPTVRIDAGESTKPAHGAITVPDSIERELKQDQIMSILHSDSDSEPERVEIKPVQTKTQQTESLLTRARELATHNIETDEAHKEASIAAITRNVLKQVDEELQKLKHMRPYAPLSSTFVRRKMAEDTREFRQSYEQISIFVATQAPRIEELQNKLFKERETRFPMLPLLKIGEPRLHERTKEGKLRTPTPSLIPSLSSVSVRAASKKLPYKQRQNRARPIGLPGDSDIEEVSQFSSEVDSSETSVEYLADPDFYKPGHSVHLGEPEAVVVSEESSSAVKSAKEVHKIDMNDFAELTSSSSSIVNEGAKHTEERHKAHSSSASFDVTRRETTQRKNDNVDDEMFNLSLPSVSSDSDD